MDDEQEAWDDEEQARQELARRQAIELDDAAYFAERARGLRVLMRLNMLSMCLGLLGVALGLHATLQERHPPIPSAVSDRPGQ